MCNVFNGYELLLFKRFQSHPEEWKEWREKLKEREDKGQIDSFGDIPQELWFLSVCLHQRPRYLLQLVHDELDRAKRQQLRRSGDSLLTHYIDKNHFTEFHLDSIFKYGEDNKLPKEIFRCENVRYLSMKYNCLYEIPPDIGRLQKLEYLALTNNRLHVQSIPYTLTFCSNLKTLMLDNNLLDALPGFLLQMQNIETVHRHGNHNYFKSTFMWYHTDVQYRIIPLYNGGSSGTTHKMCSLAFWASKALIGSKKNFFTDECVAPILKDYICDIYEQFNICHNCTKACLANQSGFKVITFKNPYLGNTCVPFQHWVCSFDCARALEIPARYEQISKAKELDSKYEKYVKECQRTFKRGKHNTKFSCLDLKMEDLDETYTSDNSSMVSDTVTYASSEFGFDFTNNGAHPVSKRCIVM